MELTSHCPYKFHLHCPLGNEDNEEPNLQQLNLDVQFASALQQLPEDDLLRLVQHHNCPYDKINS